MKKQSKKRSFRQMNQNDRDRISLLKQQDFNQKEIAETIKFSESAISREITKRRNKNGEYDPEVAQLKADNKRSNSKYQGKKIGGNTEMKKYIIEGLKAKKSPDEISGRMKLEKKPFYASKNCIYSWLYSVWGQKYCKLLCTKRYKPRKQKKNKTKREMISDRISLELRPKQGIHGQGDTFLSPKKSKSKHAGALICEPTSQLLVGEKICNLKMKSMTRAVNKINKRIKLDDLTLDNGIENRDHKNFGIPSYFADAHSPWQKPNVENNIGLLRKWFIPKGTNLSKISNDELQEYLHILNSKYRKSLGYRNAYEVAFENGIIKKIPETYQEAMCNYY